MENPAKFVCQNKGRNTNDKTMKALANDILAKCQEQGAFLRRDADTHYYVVWPFGKCPNSIERFADLSRRDYTFLILARAMSKLAGSIAE